MFSTPHVRIAQDHVLDVFWSIHDTGRRRRYVADMFNAGCVSSALEMYLASRRKTGTMSLDVCLQELQT